MSTRTAARPNPQKSSHWYGVDGIPVHEVPKADGKGMRPTTVADARKRNLLPGVSSILSLLHKEALVTWRLEQACLAIVTAPRLPDEKDDAFVYRVLHTEKQQDQEARIAADKGTLIHDAMQAYFQGQPVADNILPFIEPAFKHIWAQGEYVTSECVLVGTGYAGTTDLLQDCGEFWKLSDYKATKNLPEKGPWPEHRLQLSAYAKAHQERLILAGEPLKPIKVANVYISTVEAGKFVEFEHGDWEATYNYGFAPLVLHWQWANNHVPKQEDRDKLSEGAPLVEAVKAVEAPPQVTTAAPSPAPAPEKHKSGKTVVYAAGTPTQ